MEENASGSQRDKKCQCFRKRNSRIFRRDGGKDYINGIFNYLDHEDDESAHECSPIFVIEYSKFNFLGDFA